MNNAALLKGIRSVRDEQIIIDSVTNLKELVEHLDRMVEHLKACGTDDEDLEIIEKNAERKDALERMDAYLDALLEVLKDIPSARLLSSKTYKAYLNCHPDDRGKMLRAVRRYLLKLHGSYVDDPQIDRNSILFSYYIDFYRFRKKNAQGEKCHLRQHSC